MDDRYLDVELDRRRRTLESLRSELQEVTIQNVYQSGTSIDYYARYPIDYNPAMQGYNLQRTDGSTASSATTREYAEMLRNPLQTSITMNVREEPSVIVEDSDSRNAVIDSSLVTTENPDNQRIRDEYSHLSPPSVAKDQVTTDEEDEECAICLDTTNCTQMKALPCAHVFHEVCVDMWLNVERRCPLCRREATFSSPHENFCPEATTPFLPLFQSPGEFIHLRQQLRMQEEELHRLHATITNARGRVTQTA